MQGVKLRRQPMGSRPRVDFGPNLREPGPPLLVGHVNRLTHSLGGPFDIQRRDHQCVSSDFGRDTARFGEDDHPGPLGHHRPFLKDQVHAVLTGIYQ